MEDSTLKPSYSDLKQHSSSRVILKTVKQSLNLNINQDLKAPL